MNSKERLALIERNLQEIIGESDLIGIIRKRKRLGILGDNADRQPACGILLNTVKNKRFFNGAPKVKILVADLHAHLDGVSWEILDKRQKYYRVLIP